MSAVETWESLLDRSIRAFYEGELAEGRLACDRLLSIPDLPPHVRAVTRTNQVYYAQPLPSFALSSQESTIAADTFPGWGLSGASIAADGDSWLTLLEFARNPAATGDPEPSASPGILTDTTQTLIRVDRDLRLLGRPAPVLDQTDPKGAVDALPYQFAETRLLPFGERWLAMATVHPPTLDAAGQLGLLSVIPSIPAFRNLRILTNAPNGLDTSGWMPVAAGEGLYFVSASGPTAVIRCQPTTGALALEAFRDAPFLTRDLHGGSPLVVVRDGYLALLRDVVPQDDGKTTYLHRFARFDGSFRLSHLSHPFLVTETGAEPASGLALAGETLALTAAIAGHQLRIVTIDLAEALSLLQPVESLSPGGLFAFPMPDAVLAALEHQTAPDHHEPAGIDIDRVPVLRPETIIAAMHDPERRGLS